METAGDWRSEEQTIFSSQAFCMCCIGRFYGHTRKVTFQYLPAQVLHSEVKRHNSYSLKGHQNCFNIDRLFFPILLFFFLRETVLNKYIKKLTQIFNVRLLEYVEKLSACNCIFIQLLQAIKIMTSEWEMMSSCNKRLSN